MEHVADRLTLFLFRHGETDWNREGRLQGHTDTQLNANGIAQAEALARRLLAHRLDAVMSSDLSRALTTARIIAEILDVPVITDHGLREVSVGLAEGMLWEEAKARFGAELTERWYSDDNVGVSGRRDRRRDLDPRARCTYGASPRPIRIAASGSRAMVRWCAASSNTHCRPTPRWSEPEMPHCLFLITSRPPTGWR